jgi:hypothetical protein
MTDTSSKTTRGHGRVAFFAHLDAFRKLLDAGYSLRSIYDDHSEKLGIGYPQFTKYVGRYIKIAKNYEHQKENLKQDQQAVATNAATGTGQQSSANSTAPTITAGTARAGKKSLCSNTTQVGETNSLTSFNWLCSINKLST